MPGRQTSCLSRAELQDSNQYFAMATLPHEIKRLVYDYADLETIKALRLVSPSWAAVGIEVLFLPKFVINSYAIDLQRLVDIGSVHNIALQAAKTIRTLEFRDNQYDPSMVRRILCSRHVQVSNYESVDFVPSELEQASFDEIDAVITRRKLDDQVVVGKTEQFLIEAFRNAPFVDTICFPFPNPFQQVLLSKVWDEYEYETYTAQCLVPKCSELLSILTAINRAGLTIRNFIHERFMPHRHSIEQGGNVPRTLTDLRSLKLSMLDLDHRPHPADPDTELDQCPGLRNLLLANSRLEDLSIHFQSLTQPSFNYLPSIQSGHLKILALTSNTFRGADFRSFLFTSTLRSALVLLTR
jgi:hypothetical protein